MKGSRRHKTTFNPSALQHVYQRSLDKGVIFYTIEDRLVFMSLSAVDSKRHNVRVGAASVMFTHTHQSLIANSMKRIEDYIHDCNTSFARAYNHRYSRKGQLFSNHLGKSEKVSSKEKRNNISYVFNNHVEKKLCESAMQERWSFVPYAFSTHPFSEKIDRERSSLNMKRALNFVDRRVKKQHYLDYRSLDRILNGLNNDEKEQFIDYAIAKYAWVDFSISASLFGGYDSLQIALDSTTGSEYDINEDYYRESDVAYRDLISNPMTAKWLRKIFTLSVSEKKALCYNLLHIMHLSSHAISKFLHCEIH